MDVHTEKQRSYNMSRVKSKNTEPELMLRKLLVENKVKGYRIHYELPGKPDIVFPKKRLAIFIDGCFWHRCKKCFVKPKTRSEFWEKKIESNVVRDRRITGSLKIHGWKVIRFWEHRLKNNPKTVINRILSNMKPRTTLKTHLD